MEIKTTECDPWQIVQDVVVLMEVCANAKGLVLSAECVPPIPKVIHTDAPRFRQILVNLVGNAVKFTEHGGVNIFVKPTFPIWVEPGTDPGSQCLTV